MTLAPSTIELTERARQQVRSLIGGSAETAGFGLRVGVNPGGCSGFTYALALTPSAENDDIVINEDGFDVFIHNSMIGHLRGLRIDYVESLTSSGFTFTNPNASSSCGCGNSFGTPDEPERAEADAQLRAQVEDVITEIRPFLQGDGGDVQVVTVLAGNGQPGTAEVHIRLTGACNGCSSASATVTAVIEKRIKENLPEIGRVALVS
ncbi:MULTISPECIES: iron-sulfur cluster assembly accessory protein [Parafrankia]|uniref:Heme biosynthesis protein HemY n=1 Tax=Parafrankia colletiae TaxID=573497 RepID=A0A1S1QQ90_9ACTN|nr:iron-sulfur cluster assembly accessory protein [Parafrankia colletiae]MCK9902371.1 iron-sulfur cluster assembly accessory protein [Frankia sp. Cpl3]OHV35746.1 heme biosynthesis protein HemY [Parafrankia colletiae]